MEGREEGLDEFKSRIPEDLREFLSDRDCNRFIRARKGNVENAVEFVKAWWEWFNKTIPISGRGNVPPRSLLETVEDINESIYYRLTPHSNYGIGKEGHPVYWEQTGVISTRMGEMNKSFTIEDMVTRHIRQQEIAVARMEHYSALLGKPIDSQIIVMDLSNLSYKLDTKALSTFKQTLIIDQNYYPERLHVLFMINAPWFFTAMWSMIKPWIDPVTVDKFQIIGTNYLPKLREHINDEHIPAEYGGSCENFPWKWPLNNQDYLESINYTVRRASFMSVRSDSTASIAPSSPLSPISLRAPAPTIQDVNLPLLYFRMHKVEDMGGYHGYRMLIRYTDLQSWQVIRRYSEFRKFRQQLKRISATDGYVQWPRLPPKAFFRKSKMILSQRFLGLELFVSAVITKVARAQADVNENRLNTQQNRGFERASITYAKRSPLSKGSVSKLKLVLLEFLDAHANMAALLVAQDQVVTGMGHSSQFPMRPGVAGPVGLLPQITATQSQQRHESNPLRNEETAVIEELTGTESKAAWSLLSMPLERVVVAILLACYAVYALCCLYHLLEGRALLRW